MNPDEIKAQLIENLEDQIEIAEDQIEVFEQRIESDMKAIERHKKKKHKLSEDIKKLQD